MSNISVEPGACDCHMHFYRPHTESAIAALANQQKIPPPTVDAKIYQGFLTSIGLTRFVAVQSVAYGFDNSVMLEEASLFGDNARLIPVLPVDISDEDIAWWESRGARGIRAYLLEGGGACYDWDMLPELSARIQPFGWHLQIQFDGRNLPERETQLKSLSGDIVIDHVGKFLEPVSTNSKEFASLLRLVDTGRIWVKLSAPYETSKTGRPWYEDVSTLVHALVKYAPERLVWGSNYPHPGMKDAPSAEELVALLEYWIPDTVTRRLVLKENPETLYRF